MLQYIFATHTPVYTFPWKQPKKAKSMYRMYRYQES